MFIMTVDEARGVFEDSSRWRSVVSAYPLGKRLEFMYVCMYVTVYFTTIHILFGLPSNLYHQMYLSLPNRSLNTDPFQLFNRFFSIFYNK